jgi:DNA-binding transcriptional MerR regulator
MILSQRTPSTAPIEKSPEAYRTIREVADSLDLPQHVLRFWETRFPQIRPLKRAGGRRYYRPDDIERLRLIKRLLYEQGYTIKGVQKLFKEQGVQALSAAPPSLTDSFAEAETATETPVRPPGDVTPPARNSSLPHGEIVALREALAEIMDAQRILSQANAPVS